jgi:hypothetical protein
MFRLNEMSKMEFVHKMNVIQNKNATKWCLMTSGFSKTSFSTAKNLNCLNLENESSPTLSRSKLAISFLIRVMTQRCQLRHLTISGETTTLEVD